MGLPKISSEKPRAVLADGRTANPVRYRSAIGIAAHWLQLMSQPGVSFDIPKQEMNQQLTLRRTK
ncbi:hypothetical protein [Spirosoma knui]